jgi:phospholipase/lecithinase/hemolysin
MKQMPMWVTLVAACALAAACAHERANEDSKGGQPPVHNYSKIVVFGDGLSDQGRFGRLTDNRYPPSPPFHRGRWTNGPTWIEHLAKLANIPLAAEDNYAQGGA